MHRQALARSGCTQQVRRPLLELSAARPRRDHGPARALRPASNARARFALPRCGVTRGGAGGGAGGARLHSTRRDLRDHLFSQPSEEVPARDLRASPRASAPLALLSSPQTLARPPRGMSVKSHELHFRCVERGAGCRLPPRAARDRGAEPARRSAEERGGAAPAAARGVAHGAPGGARG